MNILGKVALSWGGNERALHLEATYRGCDNYWEHKLHKKRFHRLRSPAICFNAPNSIEKHQTCVKLSTCYSLKLAWIFHLFQYTWFTYALHPYTSWGTHLFDDFFLLSPFSPFASKTRRKAMEPAHSVRAVSPGGRKRLRAIFVTRSLFRFSTS